MQDHALRYARLVRPFPVKKLADALYYVQADAASLDKRLTGLLVDPPATPEKWRHELQELDDLLWSLTERVGEARPVLRRMGEWAQGDFDRAVAAVQSMMRGLAGTEQDAGGSEEAQAA